MIASGHPLHLAAVFSAAQSGTNSPIPNFRLIAQTDYAFVCSITTGRDGRRRERLLTLMPNRIGNRYDFNL
jgi:hypothetical protein